MDRDKFLRMPFAMMNSGAIVTRAVEGWTTWWTTYTTCWSTLQPERTTKQLNPITWDDAQERAYHSLKMALKSSLVLHRPDIDSKFVLSTDASDRDLGADLAQNSQGKLFSVACASKNCKIGRENIR
ncbi:retrovirus-related pol polyprotein from transposon 412 [Plakobranchus ocellatus]|uniref:Retrovirus-related pol polyprotein from transposon 412 n=1 Tax=Plakobranchus ocellatus TaxID=259542 RepID=A0AAV4AJ06_9GAST|nr:retrovirus-related pol polyprotein from transposon 412 [Plakobranchus ocellatus]